MGALPFRPLAAAAALIACAALPARAGIEPEAERVLRAMAEHLAGLRAFEVSTESAAELVLHDGRKVQVVTEGSGVLDRERGFRFARKGPLGAFELAFDGERMTLWSETLGGWHALPVEGGNDAALDEARMAFGIEAAGGIDLLYAEPLPGLIAEASEGNLIGDTWIGGVRAHHVSVRSAEVDWQLWIAAEGEPLPLRYVITSKWVTAAPQFTVEFSGWNTAVEVSGADLAFAPPEGSQELGADAFLGLDILFAE
jgi:hypothetical protein